MEIFGEFLYNNPVNYILIILALLAIIRKQEILGLKYIRIILLISLPLIGTFLIFSLFRSTLPHWTAPAISTLILLASARLSSLSKASIKKQFIPRSIIGATFLLIGIVLIAVFQIKMGVFDFNTEHETDSTKLGEKDISLDIYGWRQIGNEFSDILKRDIAEGNIKANPFITTYRWFPAANLDYYAATPNNIPVLATGPIQEIHKYYWINQFRGGFKTGRDAYYITTSRDFVDPKQNFAKYFETIESADTIKIMRANKHVMNAFVYRFKNMNKLPKY